MPEDCIFCSIPPDQRIGENRFAIAIRDKYPVAALHSLILPKRCVGAYFELDEEEILDIHRLANSMRLAIQREDATVEGFNFGANIGTIAGQKIPHVHVHLIPRRRGDFAPPPARP